MPSRLFSLRRAAPAGLTFAVAMILARPDARGQELPTTFFAREAWDSCAAFADADAAERAAGAVRGAEWQPRTPALAGYVAFADGYLTARAEAGGMSCSAWRPNRTAPAMRFLAEYCAAHPVQTMVGAVQALAGILRDDAPNALTADRPDD